MFRAQLLRIDQLLLQSGVENQLIQTDLRRWLANGSASARCAKWTAWWAPSRMSSWLFPSLSDASVQEWDLAKGVALRQPVVTNVPLNAVEFQGKLVVAELVTGSVAQFAGDERTVLAEGLFVPTGLAASANNLYVADRASGRVHQVVAAGVKLTPTRIVAAGLQNPEGMALDTRGNLLVVETGTKSLVRVNAVYRITE